MRDAVVPVLLAVWREPLFQSVLRVFLWLSSINTAFWLLARLAAYFVFIFEEVVWEWLWNLLAIVYNIALAVLFSAIVYLSATRGAGPRAFLWREVCGFLLLYVALGAAYADGGGEIDEYARPGYAAGLAGYVVFATVPGLASQPDLLALCDLLKAIAGSWIGWTLSAAMTAGLVWSLLRKGMREMFYHLGPVLWFTGLLKHPPIRVRRR